MLLLYSKTCGQAIRALSHVAEPLSRNRSGTRIRFKARTLCREANLPEASTRKIFQSLVAKGLLKAVRGPAGGYQLTAHPKDISLLSIIKSVDGDDIYCDCALGLDQCDETLPCPMHEFWSSAREELLQRLESMTLQDIIEVSQWRSLKRAREKR